MSRHLIRSKGRKRVDVDFGGADSRIQSPTEGRLGLSDSGTTPFILRGGQDPLRANVSFVYLRAGSLWDELELVVLQLRGTRNQDLLPPRPLTLQFDGRYDIGLRQLVLAIVNL